MTGPVVLALEGPPGAGKTTLLGALVPALGDDVLFFTEPNIKLNSAPAHRSTPLPLLRRCGTCVRKPPVLRPCAPLTPRRWCATATT